MRTLCSHSPLLPAFLQGHPLHQRRTFALPTPYLRRCILGFRPRAKSEDAAAQVGGW